MILIIDNYDSFTYNLYQLVGNLRPDMKVVKNDELTVSEIEALKPEALIISPGPGRPKDAGVCVEAARQLSGKVPILGICLGHQAICEAFGAKVSYARELMHGKQSKIKINTGCRIFRGLPEVIDGARYHSLSAARDTIPEVLEVTATDFDGEVMAIRHKEYEVYGLQFHPESILTPRGNQIIKNFLEEMRRDENKRGYQQISRL